MASLSCLALRAETTATWATLCRLEVDALALVQRRGYPADEILDVYVLPDGCTLDYVELRPHADGLCRIITNAELGI